MNFPLLFHLMSFPLLFHLIRRGRPRAISDRSVIIAGASTDADVSTVPFDAAVKEPPEENDLEQFGTEWAAYDDVDCAA